MDGSKNRIEVAAMVQMQRNRYTCLLSQRPNNFGERTKRHNFIHGRVQHQNNGSACRFGALDAGKNRIIIQRVKRDDGCVGLLCRTEQVFYAFDCHCFLPLQFVPLPSEHALCSRLHRFAQAAH